MNVGKGACFTKFTMLLVSVGLIGGLSACTTTNTMSVSDAAPVSYKAANSAQMTASARLPQAATPLSPRITPALPNPVTQNPRSADLSDIDRGLYDHMKVGKPYKVVGQTYYPGHNPDYDKIGIASWYGDKFHGKPTANGETYNKNKLTAAHKTLPLNSYVIVTNLDTGKSVKVRLNDRGPFIEGRIIDLSESAAEAVGIRGEGLGRVRVQYAGAVSPQDFAQLSKPSQLAERTAPVLPPAKTRSEPIVEAPVTAEVKTPDYRPLRELDENSTYAAKPDLETYQVPDIMGETSGFGIALPGSESADIYDMPPIPAPLPENEEDGVVTLTIKGPVHMAGHSEEIADRPELIPASYTGEK